MKKFIFIGAALIVTAAIFFLQCEKTETIDFGQTKEALQLGNKTWYADHMMINGEDFKFTEPIEVYFGREDVSIKPSADLNCVSPINYISSNEVEIMEPFACLDEPNKLNKVVKLMIKKMSNLITYKVSDTDLALNIDNGTIYFKSVWVAPQPEPINFVGTAWEFVKIVNPQAKEEILCVEIPILQFGKTHLQLELPKSSCTKGLVYRNNRIEFNLGTFVCTEGGCCGSETNTYLASQLEGSMGYVQINDSEIFLQNKNDVQIYLRKTEPLQATNQMD